MSQQRRSSHVILWIVQGVLAALFLFAGGFKLASNPAALARQSHLPAALLRFVGACEVLGGLGLVLPGLFRVRPGLTPLAAIGLGLIMVGAVILTVRQMGVVPALFPLVVGVLLAVVSVARWPRPVSAA